MKKKYFLPTSLVLALMLLLTNCATILGPASYPLKVNSQPEGAEVHVNGFKQGNTPLTVQISPKRKDAYIVEIKKDGYVLETKTVNSKIGAKWIVLDILCGLIPLAIDAATGDWYELDQNFVSVNLIKQN